MVRLTSRWTSFLSHGGPIALAIAVCVAFPAHASKLDVQSPLPVLFEANRGQTASHVKFVSRGRDATVFLTPTDMVFALSHVGQAYHERKAAVIRMGFDGANRAAVAEAVGPVRGRSNYFIGADPSRWKRDVPAYERALFREVYRKIDLMYHGETGRLEYDFIVHPGGRPENIRLRFHGADRLEIDESGDLVLHTAIGSIRHRRPVIYQTIESTRRLVAGGFVLTSGTTAQFWIGEYDKRRALVIDPVLAYSTYLGGRDVENGNGIAVNRTAACM